MARHAPDAAGDVDFRRRVLPSRFSRLRARPHSGATRPRSGAVIETDIPDRLDSLPFGRFHLLVIVALGVTWVLDGLEVTLAGSLSGELMQRSGLGLSTSQIGLAGSSYLCGAVLGAFGFGWLTDRLGRKKLFSITLAVYLLATAATGLSWNVWSFVLFRFLTGAGIGGEYTAINSTIQELIPARFRGWTDLLINGSFWIGAAIGAGAGLLVGIVGVLVTRGHPTYLYPEQILTFRVEAPVTVSTEAAPQAFRWVGPYDYERTYDVQNRTGPPNAGYYGYNTPYPYASPYPYYGYGYGYPYYWGPGIGLYWGRGYWGRGWRR